MEVLSAVGSFDRDILVAQEVADVLVRICADPGRPAADHGELDFPARMLRTSFMRLLT